MYTIGYKKDLSREEAKEEDLWRVTQLQEVQVLPIYGMMLNKYKE